jgi:ferredoxin
MKIKVDHEACQGHARCNALAGAIFALDDAGYILPGDIDVAPSDEPLARRGARACPERALTVIGDPDAV